MDIPLDVASTVKIKRPKLASEDSCESEEHQKSDVLKYLQQISFIEKPIGIVAREHSYTRAWNTEHEGGLCKPSKLLFLKNSWKNVEETHYESGEEISVVDDVSDDNLENPFLGVGRDSMKSMENAITGLKCSSNEDWEESVNKEGWSQLQFQVFSNAAKILNNDQLARLSFVGNPNEPILVRNQVSISAKRFRHVFGLLNWETDLCQWLHKKLVNSLTKRYLVAYLEVLQTLRCKIPPLVDNLLACTPSIESLPKMSDRPWDPVGQLLAQNKPDKLPNNPLFILFTGVPTTTRLPPIKRAAAWIQLFNQVGKVVPINVHSVAHPGMMEVPESMQAVIMTGKAKVRELKAHCANRPIILLGTNTGSLLALQVAAIETVSGVVCLGYPSQSVEGVRDLDDSIVEFKSPTLFVTATHAQNSHPDVIDQLREQLKVYLNIQAQKSP
ncbi:hypothetical protein QYM36_013792 [Artemia franciscana]|uniref:KAT8 regulatory NSL complex subunit 3 n=1 Tax=Artemia franciscana TaxID=6661 RepID=A0AA88KZ64_ARTSF|nr:hypothetical protein QYM36_013792 [Artemia franciscana]